MRFSPPTMRNGCLVLFLLLVWLLPLPCVAHDAPPTNAHSRLILHSDFVLRANPLGAFAVSGALYRHVLSYSPTFRMESSYLQAGLSAGVSPAHAQVGAHLEYLPWLPLQLRVQYDLLGYFGASGSLLSFDSPKAAFGDPVLRDLSGQEQQGSAHRITFRPTLRVQLGPVLVRSQTELLWTRFQGNGPIFYDSMYDTLLPSKSWIVDEQASSLGQIWAGRGDEILLLGPCYQYTRAVDSRIERHRAGVQFYYVPVDTWGPLVSPRLFGVGGINIQDRNRDQQPFFVVGLGSDFNG